MLEPIPPVQCLLVNVEPLVLGVLCLNLCTLTPLKIKTRQHYNLVIFGDEIYISANVDHLKIFNHQLSFLLFIFHLLNYHGGLRWRSCLKFRKNNTIINNFDKILI